MAKGKAEGRTGAAGKAAKAADAAAPPRLLSGGNPQIPKGEGDAPVQAYLAALPGWKRETGHRLDALIAETLPEVRKAVKWNSPLYGIEGRGWFLGLHSFTKYLKLAFFRGAALKPPPPVASKDPDTRYFHIHEGERLDEAALADWIRQAAALPGWDPGARSGGTAQRKAKPDAGAAAAEEVPPASAQIDGTIAALGDWRGAMLARLRAVIRRADPEVEEEVKWRGVPVWSHAGILCTGETYKDKVKMTFARGAALDDPAGLFNASLQGNARRAIDIREGEAVDEAALADLIRAAVQLNLSRAGRRKR
ncbi:DUF1801 domain-containing protein [Marinibaculum pumilum]|uniref:DUF1801 domain-containing protein n=1 Tax=Marinibaculum pumilum TaxID=1766165 RepID=A0ABV7LAC2_9PROT